jgi:hypothetical protein
MQTAVSKLEHLVIFKMDFDETLVILCIVFIVVEIL